MDVVEPKGRLKQQNNIGVPRCLSDGDLEHAICLLRLIENLPLLSEAHDSVQDAQARRLLAVIHNNHLELAESAGKILKLAKMK